ncbi:MAG: hypothetical protein JSR82_24100 [Verrucomicrobia bacterium]|nr:hypothetical protein [Verrucomicrobiota bacterium]
MKSSLFRAPFALLLFAFVAFTAVLAQPASPGPRSRAIPDPLKPWEQWATWDDKLRDAPPLYSDAKARQTFWPSRLALQVEKSGARLELNVQVFAETWVPLPGGAEQWPMEVKANGNAVPVLERGNLPAVRLAPGQWRLEAAYRWNEIPQRLVLPREVGLLALTVDGRAVEAPVWEASGTLWLRRDGSTEETDKDSINGKVHAQLEDGIPMWWRVEIELVVAGKSREEEFGTILPEGWKIASAEGPLPMAIDDAGQLKVQVRSGKWTLRVDAFRSDNPKEIKYAAGATPDLPEQLVAFQARPDFRLIEISGAPSIDVTQTSFPSRWSNLPVYRWDTKTPLKLEERMRGMGQQKPAGLAIAREFWLDENGRGLVFRDRLTGQQQQTWRLDAAEGQDLGSVRNAGTGQLITRNPQTKVPGVEVRARNLNLEAVGRMQRTSGFSATGWATDADNLSATLHLPPGWRLFALFGADYVRGDWLTAWTLLDLFLVLIFTLAVHRLFGLAAAAVALVGFVLSYHEPDAPRGLWLCLLAAVALRKYAPEGWMRKVAQLLRAFFIALLLLALLPFVVQQVQQTIYPQLEELSSRSYGISSFRGLADTRTYAPAPMPQEAAEAPAPTDEEAGNMQRQQPAAALPNLGNNASPSTKYQQEKKAKDTSRLALAQSWSANRNLQYDDKSRIQTGPGIPEWTWRTATFGWNGPVQAEQQVRPVFIPLGLQRVITIVRVLLLLVLAGLLFGVRPILARLGGRFAQSFPLLLAALALGLTPGAAQAEFPEQAMLDQLRQRLTETPDAFPRAAEIPSVTLKLGERRLTLEAEIHVAARCAVPLPGRLPAWSPLSVQVNGKAEVALRRQDGFLWLVLGEGIHQVRVEGLVGEATDWEWTYQLRPRRVKIEAADWTWTGVRPDGSPEAQILFARKQKAEPSSAAAAAAAYDRKDFQAMVQVERQVELGLQWNIRGRVTRLSPGGKSVALRIPLLAGESVLTSGAGVKDGFLEVRLGAQQESFEWESNLEPVETLALTTRTGDSWVERWQLLPSPLWHVRLSGLAPTFEAGSAELVPVWQPWPGESVQLAISRPEAVSGATVTVRRALHEIALGARQRTSKLTLALNCSLGEDFAIALPAEAEVTTLTSNGRPVPVRKDGARVILPLRPGEQNVVLAWKINAPLGLSSRAEEVKLPVESANVTTAISLGSGRWPLFVSGPQRGPAVRFWGLLLCAAAVAYALSRAPLSPQGAIGWFLLAVGLTQVSVFAALVVVGWLFTLGWRGTDAFQRQPHWRFNLAQTGLVLLSAISLVLLLAAVKEGLLGTPEMFITGNGSSRSVLRWSQARGDLTLPQPGVVSVSIWWYRAAMLLWALWLAAALLRWLRLGWTNLNLGGFFRHAPAAPPPAPAAALVPPPLPTSEAQASALVPPPLPPDAPSDEKPGAPEPPKPGGNTPS